MEIFIAFWIAAPIILFFGMLYGDYVEGEWTPPWRKKKDGVNSGAKFG